MKILRYLTYIIAFVVIISYALTFYVDYKLANKEYPDSYNDCRKIWSARGLYGDGVEQNSIPSIKAAFAAGAMGAEVDLFYDIDRQDFIVSHSLPYSKKQGKLLPLEELFDATGEGHYIWMDFKRIRHLSDEQTQDAIQRLHEISEKNGLYKRLYVEGEAPFTIAEYRKAGFHTIFDTHAEPESQGLLSTIMINAYKIVFYFGGHSVMGIEYGDIDDPVYGPENRKRLKDVPVFLYHVPVDDALVDELLKIKNVRAMIVGSSQSVNFHNKNSCNQ